MARIITDYLDETSKKYPNKIALSDSDKQMTFGEVRDYAIRIASFFVAQNVTREPIMLFLEKSIDVIVCFQGIAYSGNFYTPIDIGMPKARIVNIIQTLNPAYIVTREKYRDELIDITSKNRILTIDELYNHERDEERVHRCIDKIIDTDALYVLFTSGSTGVPKGVVISHRSVIDYTEWVAKTFGFSKDNVIGNQAPFYFDNSILDIYQCLKCGSKLEIIPESLFSTSDLLLDYLNTRDINTIFWVPSALCLVANQGTLDKIYLKALKMVLFCGEVMPNKQLNAWRKTYKNVLFANLYGPTEITDACTYYIVNREFEDDEPLPIGIPCQNTDIIVLGEDDLVIGEENIGSVGELCVRGTCLTYGYYNNTERTKESLVKNPLNNAYYEPIYRTGDLVEYNEYGELIYVGRKDFQIKISGYRIELGEIETAVSAVEAVNSNCCIFDDKKKQILCVYTGGSDKKEIKDRIKKIIPRYMMPHRYIKVDAMPLNLNGKIDRVKLKQMYAP